MRNARGNTTFGNPPQDTTNQQLQLYKAPATIRDMQTTYFNISVMSNLTKLQPVSYFYANPLADVAGLTITAMPWFGYIGTQRNIDIRDIISSLMDIRVEPDKYFYEINLAECTMECDPTNYLTLPDYVILADAGPNNYVHTQRVSVVINPADGVLTRTLVDATKTFSPQTLYCRIRELSNNEPYNWSVTNSGSYSIDKSHQAVVRFGDLTSPNLTFEYGHIMQIGDDLDQAAEINRGKLPVRNEAGLVGFAPGTFPTTGRGDNRRGDKFVYVDYNREVFNAYDTELISAVPVAFYPAYAGLDGNPIIAPANRPPYVIQNVAGDDRALQCPPLLYSQQANRITFRFSFRCIHMW